MTTSRRTARSAESSAEGAPVVHPSVGPTDSILDVPGLRVGQVEIGPMPSTPAGSTGVTAIVAPAGALGAVDVRGAAPGTRETDTLSVLTSGEQVHAILLVGRSVFGLAAADGATAELERRGIGLPVDREDLHLTIPIVAAAVVFDFAHGDPAVRPGPDDGARAVAAALDGSGGRPRSGNAGAGVGAITGGIVPPRLKGGVGHASLVAPLETGGLVVGAIVVLNSSGGVIDPASNEPWAIAGRFGEAGPLPDLSPIASSRAHTTLAVIGTNARLSKAQLGRVAAMAHDGMARAIRPVHTGVDGDVVFALAAGSSTEPLVDVRSGDRDWAPAAATIVGSLAADALTRAILDAIRSAEPSGGFEAFSGGGA